MASDLGKTALVSDTVLTDIGATEPDTVVFLGKTFEKVSLKRTSPETSSPISLNVSKKRLKRAFFCSPDSFIMVKLLKTPDVKGPDSGSQGGRVPVQPGVHDFAFAASTKPTTSAAHASASSGTGTSNPAVSSASPASAVLLASTYNKWSPSFFKDDSTPIMVSDSIFFSDHNSLAVASALHTPVDEMKLSFFSDYQLLSHAIIQSVQNVLPPQELLLR